MKKSLLSIALTLFSLGAMAQVDETFVFCDSEGNTIANGSVVNVMEGEEDEFTGETKMHSGLYVKYNGEGNGAWAGMSFNIKQMDNGKLQHCFPGNCYVYDKTGLVIRTEGTAVRKDQNQSINSEWLPTATGLCTVDYTLHVADRDGNLSAEGPTVTINYCNGVDGISSINAQYAGKTYNLQGQEVNQNYSGVVIRNGKKLIKK